STLRGRAPNDAVELLAFQGRPLAEIVRLFVKFSNNAVAETLVKSMGGLEGRPGGWASGVAALRERLREFGLEEDGLVIVDGSGLSYSNKVSARTLVNALRLANESFRVGPELKAALPLAGEDGTLERRAQKARGAVRAKTGLLNQVTGLSGYARLADGEAVTFSLLVNGYRGTDEDAMAAVDHFVAELVLAPPRPMRHRKFGR
ncbi:MAG: D-alanyl-D-alanine carboxypeptidase/D-alanyl-D-alanine-endopeptidase, partial [Myxococcota bacterium]